MNADAEDAEVMFGLGLRHVRQQRGWTQQDLAEHLAGLGLTLHQSVVARIETASRPVRLSEALLLARALGVELQDLLSGVEAVMNEDIARLEIQRGNLANQRAQLQEELAQLRSKERQLTEALDEVRMSVGRAEAHLSMADASLRDIEARLAEVKARRTMLVQRQSSQ